MSDQLTNAQETFGRTLGRWFALNAWPQSVTEGWAKAVGSENGPWSSQISPAMRNKILPKPHFFYALGEFNRFVHEKKDLNKITDRVLRDRLTHGEALCHADGTPFDSTDFYGLFVGAVQPPEIAEPSEQITDALMQECVTLTRNAFKAMAIAHMISPAECWQEIERHMVELDVPRNWITVFQEVCAGWRELSGAEGRQIHKETGGHCYMHQALLEMGCQDEEILQAAKRFENASSS